jgi:hypothetical protein
MIQKLVQSRSNPEQNELLERLRNKPFWIWDRQEHRKEDLRAKGDCCFNHIIGLPTKDKIEKPNVVAANRMSPYSMGIDPGFGSSPFGIVITQWTDGQTHVLYAEEFELLTLTKCCPKCRL